jgi:hypothetical protein
MPSILALTWPTPVCFPDDPKGFSKPLGSFIPASVPRYVGPQLAAGSRYALAAFVVSYISTALSLNLRQYEVIGLWTEY